MSEPADDGGAPRLHALLVGIDNYLPNRLPGGVFYSHLRGAVRDVGAMEAYLRNVLGVDAEDIDKLTASEPGRPEPPEPRERWPTYESLTSALRRLEGRAAPGEHVLVHFSGHGGRTPTAIPAVKGPKGLDECLVPLDIGEPGARYLRDVEIAAWLQRLRKRNIFATLVLDCCHAGGAHRRNERLRGIDVVDRAVRPSGSLLADEDELAGMWRRSTARQSGSEERPPGRVLRQMKPSRSWDVDPTGFALLAACTPRQRALEAPLDLGAARGVLTFYLLAALARSGPRATYRELHEAVRKHVALGRFGQTPMLIGEGEQLVWGRRRLPEWRNVVDFGGRGVEDGSTDPVEVDTGVAQGVFVGARLVVQPPRGDACGHSSPPAIVEILEAGAVSSRARRVGWLTGSETLSGGRTVLLDPGARVSRQGVWVEEEVALFDAEASAGLRAALSASPWVDSAQSPQDALLRLGASREGSFELRDAHGAALRHTGPPLRVGGPETVPRLVGRLEHLARFARLRELRQTEPGSALEGKLEVRLGRLPEGRPTTGQPRTVPFTSPAGPYRVRCGEWVQLRIFNRSRKGLYIAVLDLQPDWGVTQVHPPERGGDFEPVDPGMSLPISLEASLPGHITRGTDTVKIFATTAPVSWRWLELPPLAASAPSPPASIGLGSGSVSGQDAMKDLATTSASPSSADALHEWVSARLELEVVREDGDR